VRRDFFLVGAGILKEFPVAATAAISAGGFFIGLGEWINHPLQTTIIHANAYRPGGVMTGHPRSNSIIGIAFVVVGVGLVCYGLYRLSA
jgi:hypothetical protein